MLRLSLLTVLAIVLGMVATEARPSAAANPFVFQTDMFGAQVVPSVNSTGWGFVRFFFSEDRMSADYTVDVKGFSGSLVMGADIRRGAPGTNGPIVRHLADAGFIVMGSHTTFTRAELDEMAAGQWYVTLYTSLHPTGEMRGQIVLPPDFAPSAAVVAPPAIAPNAGAQPAALQPQASLPPVAAVPPVAVIVQAQAPQPVVVAAAPAADPPLVISPPNTGDGGLLIEMP